MPARQTDDEISTTLDSVTKAVAAYLAACHATPPV